VGLEIMEVGLKLNYEEKEEEETGEKEKELLIWI
jgi:hypothetical protein